MTSITEDLAALLGTISQPGDFFTAGTTELLAPLLTVEGVGSVALPLLPVQAQQLVAVAEPAPYGRGEATVFDPAVRRCWQIGPERVRISGRHWAETLRTIMARAADGLGVSDPISAEFYKLLVYDPGSFFVGHRDTEKAPGMFATLLVVLPSQFSGGALVVRHKDREVQLDMVADDPAEAAFAAFYADCVHEVLPVTDGYRITLVYNLVRGGRGRLPEPPDYDTQQARAAELLAAWRNEPPEAEGRSEKLVYLLEHAYTPAELGFPALKGADAAIAGVLAAAAPRARCDLHLAMLTIEENGSAEYSASYGSRRRHWEDDEDNFEAGDVDDRSVVLSDWRRPDGGACVLGEIPVEEQEFSPPNACEDLTPDEQEFHEATGNEGVSFDRTYRRAALVLWPTDRMFAVLSQAGLAVTVPYLEDLCQRWADSGAGPEAPLWQETRDLAGHMLARWPEPPRYGRDDGKPTDEARVLDVLSRLGDTDTIESVLTQVIAGGSYETNDNTAILRALGELEQRRVSRLIERIADGTAASVFGAVADLLRRAAAEWPDLAAGLAGAATRLVKALPGDPTPGATDWYRPTRSRVDHRFVADLLLGAAAIDAGIAQRAVTHILAQPTRYGMDAVLVPALRQLVAAGPIESEAIELLRFACLAHLRARAAEELSPPADWRRANDLGCNCARCAELGRFLANPATKEWALRAAETDRRHVADTIRQAKCDLDQTTDKRGRPYSLVCTKNQNSYERRAKQRRQDLDDLALFAG